MRVASYSAVGTLCSREPCVEGTLERPSLDLQRKSFAKRPHVMHNSGAASGDGQARKVQSSSIYYLDFPELRFVRFVRDADTRPREKGESLPVEMHSVIASTAAS